MYDSHKRSNQNYNLSFMIKLKQLFTLIRPINLRACNLRSFFFCNLKQSKYYKVIEPLDKFFNRNDIEFLASQGSKTIRLKYCPFCSKPHNNDPTNLHTLNVNSQSGVFFCHRCSHSGGWLQLKQKILGIDVNFGLDEVLGINSSLSEKSIDHLRSSQKISQVEYFIFKNNLDKQQYKDVMQYLASRGFKQETIKKYNLGAGFETFFNEDGEEITVKVINFPMYRILSDSQQKKKLLKVFEYKDNVSNLYTDLAKVKIRGIGPQNKRYMRQKPNGPQRGFFGLNLINKNDQTVVITQGQFDAMAVNQYTGMPALSLPQGAGTLPDSIIPYLDQFTKIILWMDNDEAGKVNVQKFAQKLGVTRTFIVNNTNKQLKDANDFLLKQPSKIPQLIQSATTIPDKNLIRFQNIRDLVKNRIFKQKQNEGVQLSWFNFFNTKVKGIRMAQVSIVSGPTGSGKTTLLSQLTIDLCKKRIPVLWGSFQIRNQILVTNMITQFSQVNLFKNKNSFDFFADNFNNLPLYYMNFHGSNGVDKVLGTITYAIEKYGVSVVVIDTLQFLLSNQAEGYKKFDLQDYVMSQLRTIATTYNVHIIIVIHPRKTEDNQDLGIHSIYGTSKATQEADNIWIIQNRDGFKIFDIKKNRYDGEIGKVALGYNRGTKSFIELKKTQLQNLYNKEKTIHDIVEEREAQKGKTELNLEDDGLQGSQYLLAASKKKQKKY